MNCWIVQLFNVLSWIAFELKISTVKSHLLCRIALFTSSTFAPNKSDARSHRRLYRQHGMSSVNIESCRKKIKFPLFLLPFFIRLTLEIIQRKEDYFYLKCNCCTLCTQVFLTLQQSTRIFHWNDEIFISGVNIGMKNVCFSAFQSPSSCSIHSRLRRVFTFMPFSYETKSELFVVNILLK